MIEKGVLHLDQSEFVGMRKEREEIERKEKEWKGKKIRGGPFFYWFSSIRTARVRRSRSELDYAPKGNGSLLLWLVLV